MTLASKPSNALNSQASFISEPLDSSETKLIFVAQPFLSAKVNLPVMCYSSKMSRSSVDSKSIEIVRSSARMISNPSATNVYQWHKRFANLSVSDHKFQRAEAWWPPHNPLATFSGVTSPSSVNLVVSYPSTASEPSELDAVFVVHLLMGHVSGLPCGSPVLVVNSTEYSLESSPTAIDLIVSDPSVSDESQSNEPASNSLGSPAVLGHVPTASSVESNPHTAYLLVADPSAASFVPVNPLSVDEFGTVSFDPASTNISVSQFPVVSDLSVSSPLTVDLGPSNHMSANTVNSTWPPNAVDFHDFAPSATGLLVADPSAPVVVPSDVNTTDEASSDSGVAVAAAVDTVVLRHGVSVVTKTRVSFLAQWVDVTFRSTSSTLAVAGSVCALSLLFIFPCPSVPALTVAASRFFDHTYHSFSGTFVNARGMPGAHEALASVS